MNWARRWLPCLILSLVCIVKTENSEVFICPQSPLDFSATPGKDRFHTSAFPLIFTVFQSQLNTNSLNLSLFVPASSGDFGNRCWWPWLSLIPMWVPGSFVDSSSINLRASSQSKLFPEHTFRDRFLGVLLMTGAEPPVPLHSSLSGNH